MAKNDVEIQMNVQDSQQMQAWLRMRQQIAANESGLERLGQIGRRAGKTMEESFDKLGNRLSRTTAEITSMVAKLWSVATMTQLINREIDAFRMRNQNSLDNQVRTANAQRSAVTSLGAGADISIDELVRRAHAQRFMSAETFYKVSESAISGAGALGANRATQTVMAVGEFAPHLPEEEMRRLASGSLELQKSFPEFSARQSVAQALQAMAVDRSENVGDFAKNVVTSIGALRAFGGGKDSFQFLTALTSGIGQRTGDPYGQVTGTAVINFAEQLKTETVGRGLVDRNASVQQQLQSVLSNDPRAIEIRNRLLGPLSADPDVRRVRAGKIPDDMDVHSRAKTLIAISELLQPGSKTWGFIKSAQSQLPGSPQEALAAQLAQQATIEKLPAQKIAQAARQFQFGQEDIQNDPNRAASALSSTELKKLLVESGLSSTRAGLEMWEHDTKGWLRGGFTAEQESRFQIGRIRRREAELRESITPPEPVSKYEGYATAVGKRAKQSFLENNPEYVRGIEKMIEKLDKIADQLEANANNVQPVAIRDDGRARPARPAPTGRLNDRK